MNNEIENLLGQIASTLGNIEKKLAHEPQFSLPDFQTCRAFTWRKKQNTGYLQPVTHPKSISLDDLVGIEPQKNILIKNTEQFIGGYPANNALLWGAKGTGKSSIIKSLLNRYADKGLRMIEVDRQDLIDIPQITDLLRTSEFRFIIFCDDLSFEASDISYKALKVALDGGLNSMPDNVVIYATSNRRHLLPEMMEDNRATPNVSGELHYSDAVEEKISLSERFGIWLSFYSFNDREYLAIVKHWVASFGLEYNETIEKEAMLWARLRASRSGRCAYQFAVDLIGHTALFNQSPS